MVGAGCSPMDAQALAVAPFDPATLDNEWRWRADGASLAAGTMTVPMADGYTIVGATPPIIDTFPGTSKPSLLFNGTSQHLDGTKIGIPATVGAIWTFVYVAYYADGANRFVADLNTNAGSDGVAFDQGLDGVGPSMRKKGTSSDGSTVAKVNTPIFVEHTFRIGAAHASVMRVNGVVTATSAPNDQIGTPTGSTFGVGWFSSGSTFYMKGHIGEMMLTRGALTVPDRARLASYMATYWGIT